MNIIKIEIISAEQAIFSGEAKFVSLPADKGEIGILPGHTPFISKIKPGIIHIQKENDENINIFVAGGVLEVQPGKITVLSDTAVRSEDIDEAKLIESKQRAEELILNKKDGMNLAAAQSEIILATAQLAALARLRNKRY